jgi:hypothetical protein
MTALVLFAHAFLHAIWKKAGYQWHCNFIGKIELAGCCWVFLVRVAAPHAITESRILALHLFHCVFSVCHCVHVSLQALESRSREFMREKAEKRALEERISALQSQIVTGGGTSNVKDSPAFRNAVKEHQERVRQEYESRLADLEKVWCCTGISQCLQCLN